MGVMSSWRQIVLCVRVFIPMRRVVVCMPCCVACSHVSTVPCVQRVRVGMGVRWDSGKAGR